MTDVAFVSADAFTTTDTNDFTVPKPAGLQNNDWLVGLYWHGNDGQVPVTLTGFTTIDEIEDITEGDTTAGIYRKNVINAASEPSDYTFNGSGTDATSNGGALLMAFRNVHADFFDES